jgi:hypothetical protein
MRLLLLIAGLLVVALNGAAKAQPEQTSANYWIPYCQRAAVRNLYQDDAFLNGYCAGIINGSLLACAYPTV